MWACLKIGDTHKSHTSAIFRREDDENPGQFSAHELDFPIINVDRLGLQIQRIAPLVGSVAELPDGFIGC